MSFTPNISRDEEIGFVWFEVEEHRSIQKELVLDRDMCLIQDGVAVVIFRAVEGAGGINDEGTNFTYKFYAPNAEVPFERFAGLTAIDIAVMYGREEIIALYNVADESNQVWWVNDMRQGFDVSRSYFFATSESDVGANLPPGAALAADTHLQPGVAYVYVEAGVESPILGFDELAELIRNPEGDGVWFLNHAPSAAEAKRSSELYEMGYTVVIEDLTGVRHNPLISSPESVAVS